MIRRLWVIEMLHNHIWIPQESEFTRESARAEMQHWIETNPHEKYRVTEYRPYAALDGPKEEK